MDISHDLLDVLATYDVLETFRRLAESDQERFSRWIGSARDDESYWIRVEALVLALRAGPLQSSHPESTGSSERVG